MSTEQARMINSLKVSDMMNKNLVRIGRDATVFEAVSLMRKEHVSCLLVDRLEHNDAWGIIVRKDIVNKVIEPGKDPDKVKVSEVMTSPLIMVSNGLSITYCIKLMRTAGIRRAPVFDGENVVGIISNTDILNAFC